MYVTLSLADRYRFKKCSGRILKRNDSLLHHQYKLLASQLAKAEKVDIVAQSVAVAGPAGGKFSVAMPTWKSILLKAAGFGTSFGIAIFTMFTIWSWYSSRPKPPKPWDTKAISAEYNGVTTESDKALGTTLAVYYTLQNNTDFDYQLKEQGERVLLAGQLERENSASIEFENLQAQFPLFIPARGHVRFGIHLKYPYSGGPEPSEGIDAIHAYRAKVADFMATELNNLNGFMVRCGAAKV